MMIQQLHRQQGFEAEHLIVRRYDQRNMSDKNSAYAALISNISERDRAKDVEHLDDILRTCINDVNKFENRIGKIRDEGETLAVKKYVGSGEPCSGEGFFATAVHIAHLSVSTCPGCTRSQWPGSVEIASRMVPAEDEVERFGVSERVWSTCHKKVDCLVRTMAHS